MFAKAAGQSRLENKPRLVMLGTKSSNFAQSVSTAKLVIFELKLPILAANLAVLGAKLATLNAM